VLEFGTLIAGPFCSRILAEFGAEVIKIEAPGRAIRCASGASCIRPAMAKPRCGGSSRRATSSR
jgi:crotonobetainyl-CoA:carnitine CoA-transferase CaiB-like acyl-CoA transferase